MASNQIKGITIEIGGDTSTLGAAISAAEKSSKQLTAELREIDKALEFDPGNTELLEQRFSALRESIEASRNKLNTLRQAQEQVQRQFESGEISGAQYRAFQRAVMQTEAAVQRLERRQTELREATDSSVQSNQRAAEQLNDMAEGAHEASQEIQELSATTIAKGQLMADAIKGAAKELINMADNTREFRETMAKLSNNAEQAGMSVDAVKNALRDLNSITGETDSNVEALSNLMQTGMSENQMLKALQSLSGAVIAFPDTLKIESLADGLQETLATGAGTGAFSELIERSGMNLDEFNAGLQESIELGTQYDYVLQTLAKTGMSQVGEQYRRNNSTLIEAKQAQFDIEQATAQIGAAVEETTTKVKGDLAALVSENVDTVENAVRAIGSVVSAVTSVLNEHGDVILSVSGAYLTFIGVLKTAQMVSGLIAVFKNLSVVLEQAAASQGVLNLVMSANPYVLAAAAIAGLVSALVIYANSIDTVGDKIDEINQKTDEAKKKADETADAAAHNEARFQSLAKTYDTLRKRYNETGEGAERLKEVIEELNSLSPTTLDLLDKETGKYRELAGEADNVVAVMRRQRDVEKKKSYWDAEMNDLDEKTELFREAQKKYMDYLTDYQKNSIYGDFSGINMDELEDLEAEMKRADKARKEAQQAVWDAEAELNALYETTSKETAQTAADGSIQVVTLAGETAVRQAEQYAKNMRKLTEQQKRDFQSFSAEQKALKYAYDTADVQDTDKYYADLQALLNKYGDESMSEYQSYYIDVANYRRKKQAEQVADAQKQSDELKSIAEETAAEMLATQKEKSSEVLNVIQNEITSAKAKYQEQYNDLISQRSDYEKKLAEMSEIFKESTQKDKNGNDADIFELLDLEKGNQAIKDFDDKLSELENRNIGKGLSDYILSLSGEQGGKMMEILSKMSDEELAAYAKSFDERTELIQQRAAKRYESQFDDLNRSLMDGIGKAFNGVDGISENFGTAVVDGFISGFENNTEAAMRAVSEWADSVVTAMQTAIDDGISATDINSRISDALSGAANIGAVKINVDTSAVVSAPKTEAITQAVKEQVTVVPDVQGISNVLNGFIGEMQKISLKTDNIGIDGNFTAVMTDSMKNKLVDMVIEKMNIRSMSSGKEVFSY